MDPSLKEIKPWFQWDTPAFHICPFYAYFDGADCLSLNWVINQGLWSTSWNKPLGDFILVVIETSQGAVGGNLRPHSTPKDLLSMSPRGPLKERHISVQGPSQIPMKPHIESKSTLFFLRLHPSQMLSQEAALYCQHHIEVTKPKHCDMSCHSDKTWAKFQIVIDEIREKLRRTSSSPR